MKKRLVDTFPGVMTFCTNTLSIVPFSIVMTLSRQAPSVIKAFKDIESIVGNML